MDNTPQQQMRDERMNGIDGPRRLNPLPLAENIKLWEDFKAGKLGIDKAADGTVPCDVFFSFFFVSPVLWFAKVKVKARLFMCLFYLWKVPRWGNGACV